TGKTQKTLPEKGNTAYMWLFLPKFDISSSADLEDRLSSLGRLDAFNSKKADFSTLTASKAFVNNVTQSTRVSIDEDGCEGASVTGQLPGISDSETYGFTLDRPFIFVVTSDTGLPLFVGTVNRPD
ncbi:MAG: hypothetical protein IKU19_05560, partial [Clostridia bacterium]|nr:hypothetical protein [Clostridia bacterium]